MNLPAFGIFRFNGQWTIAWGHLVGGNAMDPQIECMVTDEQLRRFDSALQAVIDKGQTDADRYTLPMLSGKLEVTWQGLLEIHKEVRKRIQQLDSGQEPPESEIVPTGGRN